jgi:hypothetical protein
MSKQPPPGPKYVQLYAVAQLPQLLHAELEGQTDSVAAPQTPLLDDIPASRAEPTTRDAVGFQYRPNIGYSLSALDCGCAAE